MPILDTLGWAERMKSMNFLDLLHTYGYRSMSAFSKEFAIPYRTVQSWCLGDREPPDYLLDLIDYKLRNEHGVSGYRVKGVFYPTFLDAEEGIAPDAELELVKEKEHG